MALTVTLHVIESSNRLTRRSRSLPLRTSRSRIALQALFVAFPPILLDLLFRWMVLFALLPFCARVFDRDRRSGVRHLVVVFFLVSWFYGGFFEAYWNGQTPGKRIMGLRVLSTNGRPINGYQAILRNLLRIGGHLFHGVRGRR